MSRGTNRIGLLVTDVAYETTEARVRWLELAVDEATERGILEKDIDIVVETTVGLPLGSAFDASRSWRRLVEDEGVLAVIGPTHADTGVSMLPTIDAGRCPTMLLGGHPGLVGHWTFNVQAGDMITDAYLAMAWCHQRGHQRVALIRDTAWHGQHWLESCEDAAARLGLDILRVETIGASLSDLRNPEPQQNAAARRSLERIRELAPDAVVMIASLSAVAYAQELHKMRWDIPRVAGTLAFESSRLPGVTQYWDGWVGVATWDESNPTLMDFLARWKRKYGSHLGVFREDIGSVYFDAMRLILEGIARARVLNRDGVRDGLEAVHRLPACSGASSTTMGFGPWDHRAYKGPDTSLLRRQQGSTTEGSTAEAWLSELWPNRPSPAGEAPSPTSLDCSSGVVRTAVARCDGLRA